MKKQHISLLKMQSILQQLKNRRISLRLKQKDMMLRVGISRQQYQRLESKGNPRLKTLELLAKGLNSQLVLVPQEKLGVVLEVLESDELQKPSSLDIRSSQPTSTSIDDDPWLDLLENDK